MLLLLLCAFIAVVLYFIFYSLIEKQSYYFYYSLGHLIVWNDIKFYRRKQKNYNKMKEYKIYICMYVQEIAQWHMVKKNEDSGKLCNKVKSFLSLLFIFKEKSFYFI